MPKEYKSGDVDIVIDVQRLAFNSNYQSEELHNAILRMKKTVFTHPFAEGAETAIHEVNIVMKNEFVPFVVSLLIHDIIYRLLKMNHILFMYLKMVLLLRLKLIIFMVFIML